MTAGEKQEIYFNKVNKIFPELEIQSASSIYSGEYPVSAEINLKNQSKALKNKYNFTNRFVHYTSMDALFSILTSQELRMYNCINLNDKQELKYAVDEYKIKLSEIELENFRRSFFVFSASEIINDEQLEDFNLWRLYGGDGSGVAIEFEIINPNDDWDNIFYGKVNYDKENSNYIEMLSFIKTHQEFNDQYNLFENTPSIIPSIALHFKNEIWKIENEIRLLAYCPFEEYSFNVNNFDGGNSLLYNTIKHVLNKHGKLSSYISLPLNIDFEKENINNRLLNTIPHLKIKRIIIGYNNNKSTSYELWKLISNIYSKQFNYHIDIRQSKYS